MRNYLARLGNWLNRSEIRTLGEAIGRLEHKLFLVEYFSHGSRGTYLGNNRVLVKVVVADRNIAYIVEADDLLLSPWFIIVGAYETLLTDFFVAELRPDSHCVDIGANIGYFACLFARFTDRGKVIAIEPERRIYELCRDNFMINGFQEIGTALHAAANDTGAPVTMYRRHGRSGNTSVTAADRSFTDSMGEPPVEPFTVQGVRADDLLPQLDGRVDFMKIDVEGAELSVLRGAQRIIATNPQIRIVMEWAPAQLRGAGTDPAALLDEIGAMGLRFFDIQSRLPLAKAEVLGFEYLGGLLLSR